MIVRDPVGLANPTHRDAPSCAPMRVEGSATESMRGRAQVDAPVTGTQQDETGSVRGRTVPFTGSDPQQHAAHPDSASVSASEIPRTSYTIVVQGRAW